MCKEELNYEMIQLSITFKHNLQGNMFKNIIKTLNYFKDVRDFSQRVAQPLRQKKPKADGNSVSTI